MERAGKYLKGNLSNQIVTVKTYKMSMIELNCSGVFKDIFPLG